MSQAEFDKYTDDYAAIHAQTVRLSGEDSEFFARYKIEDTSRILTSTGHPPERILDFGTGVGASVPYWHEFLPQTTVIGIDVSGDSLSKARERSCGQGQFLAYDGQVIPFPSGHFNAAFAACVFHHIEANHHVAMLRELKRVLTADGTLFIFEHNPLNPVTSYAFRHCPLDVNATMISARTLERRVQAAGFSRMSIAFRLFFPGAVRFLRPLERFLTWVPLGAQYRLVAQP